MFISEKELKYIKGEIESLRFMNKRKIGDRSEKKAAKKVQGRKIKGSGSLWYAKGDYETDRFVFQNKCASKSYRLSQLDLIKAKKDALSKNKDFVFSIELQGDFYYLFERVLISEELENKLKLKEISFNKSMKIDKELLSDMLLINGIYLLVSWDEFKRLVK
jgi:hypothetical protein